jgi:hypothetical protein
MYKDSAKFGGFATVFSGAYKLVLCALRRLGYHDDRINAPIAGFCSALSLGIEAKGRKNIMMILMLSRCVDSGINLIEGSGAKIVPSDYKYLGIFIVGNLFL